MRSILLIAVAVLSLTWGPSPLRAGAGDDREQKEKLDRLAAQLEELKSEVRMLEQQAQSLQEAFGNTSGEQTTLIKQMMNNVSAINRAQSAIVTNSEEASKRLSTIGEQLTAVNERLEQLGGTIAESQKQVEEWTKQPASSQITPGNPEQLFAVAYLDYSRHNYALALSEFQQFVDTYRSSDLADNAQYWMGEIFYEQQRFQDALEAFAAVAVIAPKGDKVTIALYRRAQTFEALGRREDAVRQLQALIKAYPKSLEAEQAKQQLQQWQ